MSNDLSGKTLLITRAAGDAGIWAERIEARGGRVLHMACIEVSPIEDPGTGASLRAALLDADWLVLSSVRAVAAFTALHPFALPEQVMVAVVGRATAEAAKKSLGRVDLIPEQENGRALAERLLAELERTGRTAKARVVAAAADRAQTHLEDVLEPHGTWIARIPVYRTLPAARREQKRELQTLGIDAILLASPSAAHGLVNQAVVPQDARVLCIGPTTSAAARALGLTVAGEAQAPQLEALLELLP